MDLLFRSNSLMLNVSSGDCRSVCKVRLRLGVPGVESATFEGDAMQYVVSAPYIMYEVSYTQLRHVTMAFLLRLSSIIPFSM